MFRLHVCPECHHVGDECICGELGVYYADSDAGHYGDEADFEPDYSNEDETRDNYLDDELDLSRLEDMGEICPYDSWDSYYDYFYDDKFDMWNANNDPGEYCFTDIYGWIIYSCCAKEESESFLWETLPFLRNAEMEDFVEDAKITENLVGRHVGVMGSCRCGFCEVTEAVLQDNTEKTFRNAKAQALAFLNKKHDRNAFCCGEIEIEFI